MCITIKQVAAESAQQKNERRQAGFTLVEVLVSLCVILMVMLLIYHWGPLMYATTNHINKNDQAIYLAQQALAGLEPQCLSGWQVSTVQTDRSALLQETIVTVRHGQHSWEFYYAGRK